MPHTSIQYISPPQVNTTIGTETLSRPEYPTSIYWDYGTHMYIYDNAEIGIARTIVAISFNMAKGAANFIANNQTLKLFHTTDSVFTQATLNDMTNVNVSDLTTVNSNFTWTVDATDGWKRVDFPTHFPYNGNDNLVIRWENNDGSWVGTSTNPEALSSAVVPSAYKSFYQYQDFAQFEGTDAGSMNTTHNDERPNIILHGF